MMRKVLAETVDNLKEKLYIKENVMGHSPDLRI